MSLQPYIVEVDFVHSQSDLDILDVLAQSRAEAEAIARTLFRRRAWGLYHEPQIVAVMAHESSRRYHLDLGSDDPDLGIGEAN